MSDAEQAAISCRMTGRKIAKTQITLAPWGVIDADDDMLRNELDLQEFLDVRSNIRIPLAVGDIHDAGLCRLVGVIAVRQARRLGKNSAGQKGDQDKQQDSVLCHWSKIGLDLV